MNDFDQVVKLFNPNVKLINDGCPGEGTETMIHGSPIAGFCGGEDASPFPYVFLHHPYSTRTQLEDALKILHETPNVSPITLDIGANDLLHFIAGSCGFPAADTCTEAQFAAEITHIATNTAFILGQLRAAAPHAQIILVGLYNPFPTFPAEGSDKITTGLNKAFETVAASIPGRASRTRSRCSTRRPSSARRKPRTCRRSVRSPRCARAGSSARAGTSIRRSSATR